MPADVTWEVLRVVITPSWGEPRYPGFCRSRRPNSFPPQSDLPERYSNRSSLSFVGSHLDQAFNKVSMAGSPSPSMITSPPGLSEAAIRWYRGCWRSLRTKYSRQIRSHLLDPKSNVSASRI